MPLPLLFPLPIIKFDPMCRPPIIPSPPFIRVPRVPGYRGCTLGTRINGQGRLFIFGVCAHPDDAYSVPPDYLFLEFFSERKTGPTGIKGHNR